MKKQNDKPEKANGKPDRSKRTMLILAVVALVLILLVGGGIWALLSMLDAGNTPISSGPVEREAMEAYLTEKWPVFRLRSWDPETGSLELDYSLRFTYEQMEKYGGTLDELKDLPAGNLSTVSALKTAAFENTGASIRTVTVYGLTTDGQTAYTVCPDGSVETCWDVK